MKLVSTAFLDAVRTSHTALFRAKILTSFQTGTSPSGDEIEIVDGSVRLDGTADIRATLDLTTSGQDENLQSLWPTSPEGALAPYGNEIFVERGIDYGTTTEYVPLGYFRIYTPEQDNAPYGPIRVTARDRMSGIIDARLVEPTSFAAGATKGSIVRSLVTEVYPAAQFDMLSIFADDTIVHPAVAEEDRFGFLKELVTADSKIMYFDHEGVFVVADVPNPAQPVFQVNEGVDGVLINLSRKLSREGIYNAVVATGTDANNLPVRAVRIDANPASPTHYFGRFGKVPRYFFSPFITSTSGAQSAADSMLEKALGAPYTINFNMIPNFALEPYDPIQVLFGDRDEDHVIDTLDIPLTVDRDMTGSTREQLTFTAGSVT